MSRRHADPVEVRLRTAESGPVPDQFLWRGRRYLVREVLARWTESGSWWSGTAIRALTTGAEVGPHAGAEVDDRETQWWRVEADSGRLAALSGGEPPPSGTYDLCFAEKACSWTLKRVMD